MTQSVGIYLFEGVEVLDFAGPYEVFTTASRVALRQMPNEEDPFAVFTVAREQTPIKARGGLTVLPERVWQDCPEIDVLVIPGGVVGAEQRRADTVGWIRGQSNRASCTASICAGAFLLAAAGLLDGKRATTHWEDVAELQSQFPLVQVLSNQRWVEEGHLMTSAGISAGIHMSLHLVARLVSHALADATARQMEFDWCDRP